MSTKSLSFMERNAMLAKLRDERRMAIEEQASEFAKTPEGVALAALAEYVEGLGYLPTRWKFGEPFVPVAWGHYPREWSGEVASVGVVPASEPGAFEVQVFRVTGRKLYAITTPSAAETLARLVEFRVDGVPVVEWAKLEGGAA